MSDPLTTILPEALRVTRFVLTLKPLTRLHLPTFHGATLRGGFGYAFKRAVCVTPQRPCSECLLRPQCAYAVIFETSPPPGSTQLRNLADVPRPFVIEPPAGDQRDYREGELLEVGLVLVGRALDYLPYFVYTFQQLGERGLGRDRVPFKLVAVDCFTPGGLEDDRPHQLSPSLPAQRQRIFFGQEGRLGATPPPFTGAHFNDAAQQLADASSSSASQQLTCRLLTPLHLRINGRSCRSLAFRPFMATLFRRLSSLCYFHCGVELELPFKELLEQAERTRLIASDLHWVERRRYSTRQHRSVHVDGALGEAVYAGDLRPFLPSLCAGEVVHLGKGCVYGMGHYALAP